MNKLDPIFQVWPNAPEMAAEIGQKLRTVEQWRFRGSVPIRHWPAIVAAAKARGAELTIETIATACAAAAAEKGG